MSNPDAVAAGDWDSDAELDPWCVAGNVLFGYAKRHPITGGLAWTRSTPIVHLDAERCRAITKSGRRYVLGRRITVETLPDLEARLAYALLVGPPPGHEPGRLPMGVDFNIAVAWLSACKHARHLGLHPPPLDPDAIRAVIERAVRGSHGETGSAGS